MTKTLALVALALGLAGAPALAYADDACMTQATEQEARRRRQDQLHDEMREDVLRVTGHGQEAAWRRNDLVRQEMHEGRDDDVSSVPPSRGRLNYRDGA